MKRIYLFIIFLIIGTLIYFFVPRIKGFHKGRLIVKKYFCSDVCPGYGAYYNVYFGVKTPEKCKEIEGEILIDPAWKGFIGCGPK